MTSSPAKKIALTFDDGPSPDNTPMLLDILSEYNVPASFCVLGSLIESNEALLKRMLSINCEIVNHSWNHEYLAKSPEEVIYDNIQRTDDAIFRACGVRPQYFRPPYGASNECLKSALKNLKKTGLLWNSDPEDWKLRDATKIASAVLDSVTDGGIIILHDIYTPTCMAAAVIIPELLQRGYELKTVSDLLKHRNPVPGKFYGHA